MDTGASTQSGIPGACLAMIADDLTGAMDAGVQAIQERLRATVCLDDGHLGELARRADLVVIDTESRNVSCHDARAAVCRAALQAGVAGARIIYKKIDSTLRGNIGAEIDALLSAGVCRAVLLAPALPGRGRTTSGGFHYVNGVRLDETEFARDPFAPVSSSCIEEIVAAETRVRTTSIGLAVVRLGAAPFSALLLDALSEGSGVVIVDAELDSDLECIAQALERLDTAGGAGRFLACGSAGLFGKMRTGWYAGRKGVTPWQQPVQSKIPVEGNQTGVPASWTRVPSRQPRQVIIVSASPAQTSRLQVRYALGALPDLVPIFVDPAVLKDAGAAHEAVLSLGEQVKDVIESGRSLVLAVRGPGREDLLRSSESLDVLRRRSTALLEAMGSLVHVAVERGKVGSLVVAGGDTARSVTRALGASGIHILAEVEPHIPQGVIAGGPCDGLRIVTKAGGFGDESTLVRIVSFLAHAGR